MSSKVKPRQQRKPRNYDVVAAITHFKGGPMKDRREKRSNNPRKRWETDHVV